jgi:hypothetical protein
MITVSLFKLAGAFLITSAIIFSPNVQGQDVVKKVVFAKGSSQAVLNGNLPRSFADYHAYTLKIRKGQQLSIDLQTAEKDAYVAIYETRVLGPDEDAILANEEHARSWSGAVPITSTYSVQVYGSSSVDEPSSGSPYKLKISVK